MIKVCCYGKDLACQELQGKNQELLTQATWIDLISPTVDEETWVESQLGIDIPTQREMQSIGLSSRFYKQNNNIFMTTMMVSSSRTFPVHQAVTFILTASKLITIRYIEPQAFSLFTTHMENYDLVPNSPKTFLLGLIEACIDRLAEHLELVGEELDQISEKIFNSKYLSPKHPIIYYKKVIKKIGLRADLNNKSRESLLTFNRLIGFFSESIDGEKEPQLKVRAGATAKEINSLSDYTNFISNKVNFLLDVTLGLINIDQSIIIKIFSIAAVIFLPPTLIASIYGMNFAFMPELTWKGGYYMALLLMLLSALFSYKFFKYKKWL